MGQENTVNRMGSNKHRGRRGAAWWAGCVAAVCILVCGSAQAERRVALVIGNADYTQQKDRLRNPLNDARDMYAKLQTIGFAKEDIVYRENLTQRSIDQALVEFEKKLGGDTVALVYYAGHGMSVNGKNYLPAVDADIQTESQVARQSISVSELMDLLERGRSRVNLMFLDACRDNPFGRGFRSASRGMTKESPPEGTWVAYSTKYGEVADDGPGRNGLFTERLLAHIGTPGLSVDQMFRLVANDVVDRTRNSPKRQRPWPEGWLSSEFYLVPGAVVPSPVHAVAQSGQTIKDCADCPELVLLPKGSFVMGSPDKEKERDNDEGPTRTVNISQAIAVGRYEVTRAEFGRFVAESQYKTEAERSNGCGARDGKEWKYDAARNWRDPGFKQGEDHPVVCVSWNDTQEYLKWLNKKAPGKNFRLLSEAEWEYSARAGTRTPFQTGQMITVEQANFDGSYSYNGSANGVYREKTVKVGSFDANAFGLYELHGNVWEWVEDVWHDSYTGAPTDGTVWKSGGDAARRVLRGGSWYNNPRNLRSADRSKGTLVDRNNILGFRIARTFTR